MKINILKKLNIRDNIFSSVLLFVVFILPSQTFGATITWDGGGGDNKWSTCTNWTTDTCPGSSDVATFDSTSNTASNVDSSFAGSVQGINITTGYTNTITLQRNLVVDLADYTQSTGTFDMSSYTMTFIGNSDFIITGGTFNEGTGTIQFGNGSNFNNHTLNVPTSETFYNFTLFEWDGYSVDLSGDTIIVKNTYTQTRGNLNNGTINWQGTTGTIGASSNGGTAVLNYASTTASQTLTINGGTGPLLTLDSSDDASDSLVLTANSSFYGLNITSGFSGTFSPTYNGYGITLSFGDFNMGAGTFNAPPYLKLVSGYPGGTDFTITGGTFNGSSTTLILGDNRNGGTNTVNVVSSLTVNNLEIVVFPSYELNLSGDTIVVLNNYTQTYGYASNGTINWLGSTGTIGLEASGGSAILNLASTTATQTLTLNGGTGPVLTVDSSDDASDSVVLTANSGFYGLNITSSFSGTFSPAYSSYNLTIGNGNFQLGAGAFNAPSASLILRDFANFTITGGTFNEGTGTVQSGGNVGDFGSHTFDVPTTETFYNFIMANYNTYATGLSGDSFIVLNNFTHTDGVINNGFVKVNGNVVVGTLADGGSSQLYFTGSNSQTYTDQGGNEIDGDIVIDKSSGGVTLASNADWNASGQDLYIKGIFDQGVSYNVTTNNVFIYNLNSKWLNTGSGDITLAGDVFNNGLVKFDGDGGGCGSSDSIAIVSSSGGTKRTFLGNGPYLLYDVAATDMASTSITAYSSTNTSGNNWSFVSQCPTTYTQNDYRWYDNTDSISPGSATAALNTAPQIDGSSPLRLRLNNTIGTADLSANAEKFSLQYSTTTTGSWAEVTSDSWWNSSWLNRRQLMFNTSFLSGSIANQPVLVRLDSSNIDYTKTKDNGEDIRFIDTDGTTLNHEIEKWDETGTSLVWVKIPQIAVGTYTDYFWMYYNNTSATDGQNVTSVWDSNFTSVWHLDETSGTSLSDSTSNAKTATKLSSTEPSVYSSIDIPVGQDFDGVNDYLSVSSPGLPTTDFTYEMWINPDTTNDETLFNASDGSGGNELGIYLNSTDKVNVYTNNTSRITTASRVIAGMPNHIVVTRLGGLIRVHINGVVDVNTALDGASFNFSTCALLINTDMDTSCTGSLGNYTDGKVEEIRISNTGRTTDQIKAYYYDFTQGLIKVGGEESSTGYVVFKDNASVSNATTLGSNLLASTDVSGSYNENTSNITNPNSATNGQEVEWDFPIDPLNAPKEDIYFRFVKKNGVDIESYTRYPRLDINALVNHQTYRWYENTDAVQPTVAIASEGSRANYTGSNPNARLRMNLSATLNAMAPNKQSFKLQYSTATNGAWTDVAGSASWLSTSWQTRKKITFNNSASSENLTDFPVLVSLTSSNIDYSKTQNSGQDIRFTDSNGSTLLSYEIEKWDESATSTVWVKVPQIDANSSSDYIYMYYNNSGASDAQSATSVWNSNYRFVQHMEETGNCSTTFTDSTSNGLNGTCLNTPAPTSSGKFGYARDFVPAESDTIVITDSTDPTSYTYSMWVKPDDTATSRGLFSRTDSGGPTGTWSHAIYQTAASKFQHYTYDGTANTVTGSTSFSSGVWYYVTIVATNAGSAKLYVNGVSEGTPDAIAGTLWTFGDRYYIGADTGDTTANYDGLVDEVRMSNVERSADWVEAEYVSMNDSMNTFGSEETPPTWIYYDNASTANGANITSTLLSSSDKTQSYVESNPTPTNPNIINKNQKGEWDFSLKAYTTLDDTVYYFRIVKSDGSLINSYSTYPEVTINTTVVVTFGGSGGSTELGSGGGTPVGGGTDQGGSDGGDGSGGGTPTGGGDNGGGGGQSP